MISYCELIGYHVTYGALSNKIESQGLMPDKFFTIEEHNTILELANALNLDRGAYLNWLVLSSISLSRRALEAYHRAESKNIGKGLKATRGLLHRISNLSVDDLEKEKMDEYIKRLDAVLSTKPVIFSVDLTGLNTDPSVGNFLENIAYKDIYYKWEPKFFHKAYGCQDVFLASTTELTPSRLKIIAG